MSDGTPTGALNYQLMRLSALQLLQRRDREAPPEELGFVMVIETMQVIAFQQAALWDARKGSGTVAALSGASRPERGAPYVRWLTGLCRALSKGGPEARPVTMDDVSEALASEWADWLPTNVLWCPLPDPRGPARGGLLLARTEAWTESDVEIAEALRGAYAQAMLVASMPRVRVGEFASRKGVKVLATLAVLAAVAATGTLPTPESVLAPAEAVPEKPSYVRAPFAGVLERLDVAPNATIRAGQTVASMNPRQIGTQRDVARKALDMARAEYAQASQEAMVDPKARSKSALLASKIGEQEAELAYQESLLDRTAIPSPIDGLAVFNDPSDWVGKPVEVGERIMLVAPPTTGRLEIQVPVADAITFRLGSRVLFYDNLSPDRPWTGTVDFASYASAPTADGTLAYAFRAAMDNRPGETGQMRLGLKGTAKIIGEDRPLALWILRKPIMAVRQWLAL